MSIVTGASIVDNISSRLENVSKTTINTVLRKVLTEIKAQLVAGNSVSFYDFGMFRPKTLAAREGESFGKAYSKPERKSVYFKLASAFRDSLNA